MPERGTSLPPEVSAALRQGNTIEAVKRLRAATGLSLKEALERVQAQDRGAGTAPEFQATAGRLPPAVVEAMQRGRKIEAIRLLREQTGLGLKEAKQAVESIPVQRRPAAGRSPGEVPRSGGLWWSAALALALAVGYYVLRHMG